MKQFSILILSLTCFVLLQACQTQRETGALTGAAVGTAAGAAIDDTEAAIIGGLLGTIVGHEIGFQMQKEDRIRTNRVLENNPTGQSSSWVNPDTNRQYQVTPTETFERNNNPCREFTMVSEYRGEQVRTKEVACRRSDGSWEIVE